MATTYTIAPVVSELDIPIPEILAKYSTPEHPAQYLAVGTIVFNQQGQVLLIQRSASDTMGSLWEIPGGGCDATDPSVLFSAARELEEETGLQATRMLGAIGKGYNFTSGSGKWILKLNIIAEVGREESKNVRIDPNEHQDYVWASEEEVQHEKSGERNIPFTSAAQKDVVLQGFAWWRAQRAMSER